jgi:hypothetical protein
MRNLILPFAMCSIVTSAVPAQCQLIVTKNWLAAHHQTLGSCASAAWLMDLDADELEIYVTEAKALVLVDRAPLISQGDESYLRKGIHGLGGIHLSLMGEVESVDEQVYHGAYSGRLGDAAVRMDQYLQLINGVPLAVVRVITRVNGTVHAKANDHDSLALHLLGRPVPSPYEPVLTKH